MLPIGMIHLLKYTLLKIISTSNNAVVGTRLFPRDLKKIVCLDIWLKAIHVLLRVQDYLSYQKAVILNLEDRKNSNQYIMQKYGLFILNWLIAFSITKTIYTKMQSLDLLKYGRKLELVFPLNKLKKLKIQFWE